MEDLSERASIPPSVPVGMTYQQTLAALSQVAKLQAWSLTTDVDWQSVIPTLEDKEEMRRGFLGGIPGGLRGVKEKYPDQYGSIDVEKLLKYATFESLVKSMNEHRQFMGDVIVHNDLHMNNILFEKNKDGSVSDKVAAVVDFGGALRGCPAFDVAGLLTISVHHKLRHQHEDEFIQYYYNEVKSLAGEKYKLSLEQFRRLYDRHFAFKAILHLSWGVVMREVVIKSDGQERVKEEKEWLDTIKALFDDGMAIWDRLS